MSTTSAEDTLFLWSGPFVFLMIGLRETSNWSPLPHAQFRRTQTILVHVTTALYLLAAVSIVSGKDVYMFLNNGLFWMTWAFALFSVLQHLSEYNQVYSRLRTVFLFFIAISRLCMMFTSYTAPLRKKMTMVYLAFIALLLIEPIFGFEDHSRVTPTYEIVDYVPIEHRIVFKKWKATNPASPAEYLRAAVDENVRSGNIAALQVLHDINVFAKETAAGESFVWDQTPDLMALLYKLYLHEWMIYNAASVPRSTPIYEKLRRYKHPFGDFHLEVYAAPQNLFSNRIDVTFPIVNIRSQTATIGFFTVPLGMVRNTSITFDYQLYCKRNPLDQMPMEVSVAVMDGETFVLPAYTLLGPQAVLSDGLYTGSVTVTVPKGLYQGRLCEVKLTVAHGTVYDSWYTSSLRVRVSPRGYRLTDLTFYIDPTQKHALMQVDPYEVSGGTFTTGRDHTYCIDFSGNRSRVESSKIPSTLALPTSISAGEVVVDHGGFLLQGDSNFPAYLDATAMVDSTTAPEYTLELWYKAKTENLPGTCALFTCSPEGRVRGFEPTEQDKKDAAAEGTTATSKVYHTIKLLANKDGSLTMIEQGLEKDEEGNNATRQLNIKYTNVNVLDGRWKHIVVSASKEAIILYLNGTKVTPPPPQSTLRLSIPVLMDTFVPVRFGGADDEHKDSQRCSFGPLRFYRRALSAEEVSTHYHSDALRLDMGMNIGRLKL